jgi:hypothetical protein
MFSFSFLQLLLLLMLAPVGSSATKQKLFWLLKLILLLLVGTKHTVEEVKSIFAKEHT